MSHVYQLPHWLYYLTDDANHSDLMGNSCCQDADSPYGLEKSGISVQIVDLNTHSNYSKGARLGCEDEGPHYLSIGCSTECFDTDVVHGWPQRVCILPGLRSDSKHVTESVRGHFRPSAKDTRVLLSSVDRDRSRSDIPVPVHLHHLLFELDLHLRLKEATIDPLREWQTRPTGATQDHSNIDYSTELAAHRIPSKANLALNWTRTGQF